MSDADAVEVRTVGVESDLRDARLDPALRPVTRSGAPEAFAPAAAPFPVTVDGASLRFTVQAIPALPGGTLRIAAGGDLEPSSTSGTEGAAATALSPLTLLHQAGSVATRAGGWLWTAPETPGAYALRVVEVGSKSRVDITVLVAHPASDVTDGVLHGYRMGAYMQRPLRGDPAYLPPRGFVEVSEEHADLAVSPHFTLGQFLCKQEGDRKFLLLAPTLVEKLEAGLARVNAAGMEVPTFHVMSGYRTPAYNRAIGNTTSYSRHLYGDAADIFVDVDGDGYMDDLNGDGRRDSEDARVLMRLFSELEAGAHTHVTPGGLGLYGPKPHRGPFLHVDARGTPARW